MEQMFRQPLTDAEAINTRSSIFQYFQTKQTPFPVDRALCEEVEQYIGAGGSTGLAGAAFNVTRNWLLKTIAAGKGYEAIHEGILSVIRCMYKVNSFLDQLASGLYEHPYRETIREVKDIFNIPSIKSLLADHHLTKLPTAKIIRYDHLLRGVCQRQLNRLMEIIYEMDVYTAISQIAGQRNFTYAQAIPFVEGKNGIDIAGLYHPQLPGAVPNSIRVDHGHNLIFLTGANMAGKSTFMKSFGIAVYLAHMGFPVSVESMTFSVQDGLYTSINVPDSLDMGYSHFYAEVLRVKQVAEEVSRGKNLVIIFDELFKGTNVKDAYDATVAVTEAFIENRNVMFIVSTHITEAGETLGEHCDNMKLLYFGTIMEKGLPKYTYRLQEGISADKHGMMIIANEGILQLFS